MTDAATVTYAQIANLREEALAADDHLMVCICDLARWGDVTRNAFSVLNREQLRKLTNMTRDEAFAACAKAINDAAAQEEA